MLTEYNSIKEQVDAREVVKYFLGEPKEKSGKTHKWTSPFREGDNDPSLCAENVKIKDFGGDFSGDIFNFVSKMNNCSLKEALDFIVTKFNVDVSKNTNNISTSKKVTKTVFELSKSNNTSNDIYCMFDSISYKEKPKGKELGIIKNRISSLEPFSYSLQQIKENIINGKTCIPAAIKSQTDWKDNNSFLQIFMIDIDNVITKGKNRENIKSDNSKHITVEKIVKKCESINLEPTFIYYTFSHSQEQHKFRLVYILDKATQKQNEIKGIYEFLKNTFKDCNIDTAPTSIASLFLGGQKIAYESNFFYQITEVEKEVNAEVIENYNTTLCNRAIRGTNYLVFNGKINLLKKESMSPISNFVVLVKEKQNYYNGKDVETFYKVECLLLDNPELILPQQIISVEQYNKFNFILGSKWDKYAILSAGATNADRLREITQLISRDSMIEKDIFAHTGFTTINNKLCFLYHRRCYRRCRKCRC